MEAIKISRNAISALRIAGWNQVRNDKYYNMYDPDLGNALSALAVITDEYDESEKPNQNFLLQVVPN